MSMMQILGAFAKNLLEEDERSRQGMMCEPKEPEKRYRHTKNTPKVSSKLKKTPKNEDVARIANKVTQSIACHIDRMVKKRQGNISYATPLGYEVSPFHNVNNPFWNQPRRRKSLVCHRKSYCPSCLRSFSSGKGLKNKSLSKIRKSKKKKEEKGKKKSEEKKEKQATKKESVVSAVERPLVETRSENLVQQPKTIWAKELLHEFREKVAKSDEAAQNEREPPKIMEKTKEQNKPPKPRKGFKSRTTKKHSDTKEVQAK